MECTSRLVVFLFYRLLSLTAIYSISGFAFLAIFRRIGIGNFCLCVSSSIICSYIGATVFNRFFAEAGIHQTPENALDFWILMSGLFGGPLIVLAVEKLQSLVRWR